MSENLILVRDVDQERKKKLNKAGIQPIEQLANAKIEELLLIEGFDVRLSEKLIANAIKFLEIEEEPKLPKNGKITSKYSMKTTNKRDTEQNF
ncbi:MAG: hypothetical protein EU532_09705 [Promethearchaeota archaeon]|nr:MAG: hypothetical protein EU532_09705 [Candidatus Lokiarchaeota archaeon]